MSERSVIPTDLIRHRLEELDDLLNRVPQLQIERDILAEWLKTAVALPNGSASVVSAKPKPQAAIIEYVRSHPAKLSTEILDALEDKIESKTKKPRGLLQTTLGRLRKNNEVIRRDGQGRHFLVEGG